jgi:molybdate transport system substrate-binding protein
MADWQVGLRVWAERAGRVVLGADGLRLLEGIGRCGSISGAARRLRLSYRKAWLLVEEMNAAAGLPLVRARTGGPGGGGAELTEHGRQALAVLTDLEDRLRAAASLAAPADAAGVRVAAAASLEDVLGALLGEYALLRPGVCVRAVYGASDELADHLLSGGAADLFLAADPRLVERLMAAGLVSPDGPPRLLAENVLAAVAPAGRDLPVRRPRDLLGPAVGRVALAAPTSPLGGYARAWLEAEGVYEALRPRALVVDSARAVVAAVQAAQADVGVVYGSAARSSPGCRFLFGVRRPPAPIRYAGAVLRRGRQPAEARLLLDFLASPAAARRFRTWGFRPAGGQCPWA